ncbi:tuliposide A-converting enzyme 2, chloroplastic-like [Musa acuminata AAA Group]|uniref:tuliposide A-converting enzyme 2, chloroplastic-like n=1 Tax=Musa acuminata AAA Group TaxID=214697 RepID=UPI0031D2F285
MATDRDAEVDVELFSIVRVYKSGRFERLTGDDVVPAGVDPDTGVASKDVVIDPNAGISARLFLPDVSCLPHAKLPVLVYYHGGGFCIESPFSSRYTSFLNSLVAKAKVIAVSVCYRLAPEHPLPTAYHDSLAALRWVASHADGGEESWLAEHGDLGRLFVSGDSAGANIAHHVARLVGISGLGTGARIKGAALIHPYFWGEEPVGSETRDRETREKSERLWRLVCPGTTGMDDTLINPLAEGAPGLKGLACERVLVEVAGDDLLRERGRAYYDGLKASGWGGEAEMVETEGEGHVFHLDNPTSDKALAFMDRLVAFLNRD